MKKLKRCEYDTRLSKCCIYFAPKNIKWYDRFTFYGILVFCCLRNKIMILGPVVGKLTFSWAAQSSLLSSQCHVQYNTGINTWWYSSMIQGMGFEVSLVILVKALVKGDATWKSNLILPSTKYWVSLKWNSPY